MLRSSINLAVLKDKVFYVCEGNKDKVIVLTLILFITFVRNKRISTA